MSGLDYSAGTIPAATIRRAGYSFVIRYVDDPARGLTRKHISAPEYRDLVAGGVEVHLVFEIATTDMLGGAAAGRANATRALRGAEAIGYPSDGLIFMACDMHVSAAQIRACLAYIDAAAAVLGKARTGVYGFPELIAASQGHAAAYWQCGHDPGPQGLAHVWQRNDGFVSVGGLQCDVNVPYHPLPAPGGPSTSNTKVEPVIENIQVVGAGALEFNVPIKGAGKLFSEAWLSARDTTKDGGGKVDAWWGLSGVGGRGEIHWSAMVGNNRYHTELTGGDVDQLTVHYDFGAGVLGVITVEYVPK